MTLKEIADMVNGTGITNRFDHFTESPAPPYVVFYLPAQNDFMADNCNYVGRAQLHIDFFAKTRDITNEGKIETALRGAGLTWYKTTDFLSDEMLYQTTYETEVLING